MFNATVYDGTCHISGTNDIANIMLSVTMICHSIYDCKKIPAHDREVFKSFVQEELGRIAFADEDGLNKESERMEKKAKEQKEKLEKIKEDMADNLAKILLDILCSDDDDKEEEEK